MRDVYQYISQKKECQAVHQRPYLVSTYLPKHSNDCGSVGHLLCLVQGLEKVTVVADQLDLWIRVTFLRSSMPLLAIDYIGVFAIQLDITMMKMTVTNETSAVINDG